MPIYEFHCEACEKSFEMMTTMSGRDAKVACPHCDSKKTSRKLSVVAVGGGGHWGAGRRAVGMCIAGCAGAGSGRGLVAGNW